MATRKRKTTGTESLKKSKETKRQVSKETFCKWQRTYEKDYQSMVWLRAEIDSQDKSLVSTLYCAICREHASRICGVKSFSRAWIEGSSNHKTSNIADHAKSEPHKRAMTLHHKSLAIARNEPITSYCPIARSFVSSSAMDSSVKERVKKKFYDCQTFF